MKTKEREIEEDVPREGGQKMTKKYPEQTMNKKYDDDEANIFSVPSRSSASIVEYIIKIS